MKQKAYARAGVDIDLGNRVKATFHSCSRQPRREVLGKVGGFGGLFALELQEIPAACPCFQHGRRRDET